MITLDINTGIGDTKISINIESMSLFNRNKSRIEDMISMYFFEFNTQQVRDEIQEKILQIFETDIMNTRKEKLKVLDNICGIDRSKKHYQKEIILNLEILKTN